MTTATTTTRGWVSRESLAKMLGLQSRRIDELRKLLPKDAQRRDGRTVLIDAQVATRLWYERQADQARRRRSVSSDGEDLEGDPGGKSEELERWRAAKASIEELNLARRRGELVPVVELREAVDHLTTSARQLGENLGRIYGPEAARQVNTWLEAAASAICAAEDAE